MTKTKHRKTLHLIQAMNNFEESADNLIPNSDDVSSSGFSQDERHKDYERLKELLQQLETAHRHNLYHHLYSIHLLKQVLLRNNPENPLIQQFVNTKIPKSLSVWPRADILINPNTDTLYSVEESKDESTDKSMDMMNIELDAVFERKVREKYALKNDQVDLDNIKLPAHLKNSIYSNLDTLLTSLQFEQTNLKLNKKKIEANIKPNDSLFIDLKKKVPRDKRLLNYQDVLKHATLPSIESFQKLSNKANNLFENLNTKDRWLYTSDAFKIPNTKISATVSKTKIKDQKLKKKLIKRFQKRMKSKKAQEDSFFVFKNDMYSLGDALIEEKDR